MDEQRDQRDQRDENDENDENDALGPEAGARRRTGASAGAAQEPDDRDRDESGRARSARPRDGLGRPLPYGSDGTPRQPEGVVRAPAETVAEAQRLLDEGKPFHAHEVFEDAWKTGPAQERALWRGMAQLAVGLTHAARGNTKGGARLLRRGADVVATWSSQTARVRPYGLDVPGLTVWARQLADWVEKGAEGAGGSGGTGGGAVDAADRAPELRGRATG